MAAFVLTDPFSMVADVHPSERVADPTTVTLHVALLPLYVAVIVAVPAPLPVTVPPLTVATDVLLDDHDAELVTSVEDSNTPSAYVLYVATIEVVDPLAILMLVLFSTNS